MIFNSLTFIIFFGIIFTLYWFFLNKNLKFQNFLLLLGSYVFYGWIDWRFLSILIGVSILNFYLGIKISKITNPKIKQLLVYIGLIQGIGGLVFFKYYNFFITSFNDAIHSLNINVNLQTLNIIIPLGISFFTFKTISYILDVNNGKIEATKNWLTFFNYVSFFPTILSGPIDLGRNFIPQLEKKRIFKYDQAVDGFRQILWGLFKKVVIADNAARITNLIFDNYEGFSSSTLLFGSFLYAIQMYADFSGYSDMAIGVARLLGFNVTKNFNFPFFAQNIADFWRKWHISLTAWLTEYVFTPLSIAFRYSGKMGLIWAIVINFTICGIWHGPRWTYVLFGFLHGCYFIPLILKGTMNKKEKIDKDRLLPTFKEFINILKTFILVMFTFIVFRADNIQHAFNYFIAIFSKSIFTIPHFHGMKHALTTLVLILILLIIEWFGRDKEYALAQLEIKWKKRPVRWLIYYCIIIMIFWYSGQQQEFIYFQF